MPETVAPALLDWVKHGPASCGLDRAPWPSGALATYLDHTQGLTGSDSPRRLFWQRQSVRP
jgi:hypothetical protein